MRCFIAALALAACSSPNAPFSVVIASPTGITLATRGEVAFDLGVVGSPDTVSLLVDDAPIATIAAPYHYVWNTRDVPEGEHRVVAFARAGDREAQSFPLLVRVDRTPPTIVTRTPEPGRDDVVLRDRITLTFSEPMRTGTATRTSVGLRAGDTDVEHTVTLRRDGLSLEITPQTMPVVPATLAVTWNALPTDLAGNELVLPDDAWQWTVPSWVTSSRLRDGERAGDARQPAVVSDPNGNVTVAFVQDDSTRSRVIVMHRDGATWTPLGAPIEAPNGGSLGRPSLFSLVEGDIYVTSRATTTQGASRILTWHFFDGGWQSVGAGIGIASGFVADEAIGLVVAEDGRPVVAWVQHPQAGGPRDLRVSFWSCTTWAPFGRGLAADENSPRVESPVLAMDDTSLVLAWREQTSDGGMAVFVRQLVAQGAWQLIGDGLRHSGTITEVTPPAIAIDGNGAPVIAYVEGTDSGRALHIDRWTTSTWAPVANDDSRAWVGDARPGFVLDREGRRVVASMIHGTSGDRVSVIRYGDAIAPLADLALDARAAGGLALTLDPFGSPVVAFEADNSIPGTVLVARSNQ